MAHSDGIRVVRYRSFEEMCFNIRVHHKCELDAFELAAIRQLAGTEVRVIFAGSATDHPALAECDLPLFRAVDEPGRAYVCAHACEID